MKDYPIKCHMKYPVGNIEWEANQPGQQINCARNDEVNEQLTGKSSLKCYMELEYVESQDRMKGI